MYKIEIYSAGHYSGNYARILIRGQDISLSYKNGLNVAIIDSENGKLKCFEGYF